MLERVVLALLLGSIPMLVGPILAVVGDDSLSSVGGLLLAAVLGASLATFFTRRAHPKGSICAQALRTHVGESFCLYLWLAMGWFARGEYGGLAALLAAVVCIPAICVNGLLLANLRSS